VSMVSVAQRFKPGGPGLYIYTSVKVADSEAYPRAGASKKSGQFVQAAIVDLDLHTTERPLAKVYAYQRCG
jgi:hypothetical protein